MCVYTLLMNESVQTHRDKQRINKPKIRERWNNDIYQGDQSQVR